MSGVGTDNVGHVNWGQSPDRPANPTPSLGSFSSTWGTSGTAIAGDDTAGTVSFTGGTSPAAGNVVTVSFANQYASKPRAVLVQGQATDSSSGDIFDATWTNTGFTIIAAAGATKSYVVKYFVIW